MAWYPWLYDSIRSNPRNPGTYGSKHALFAGRGNNRLLRILVDGRLLVDGDRRDPKLLFLLEILTGNHIDAQIVLGGNAPSDALPVTNTNSGIQGYKNWITYKPDQDGLEVTYWRDDLPQRMRLHSSDLRMMGLTANDFLEAKPNVKLSDLIVRIATRIRSDLIISNCIPIGETSTLNREWGPIALSPDAALPLVHQFQRSHGLFLLSSTQGLNRSHHLMPRSQHNVLKRTYIEFYWEAAELLLPSFPDWSRTLAHNRSISDQRASEPSSVSDLPDALRWRLAQVLSTRDRFHSALTASPDIPNLMRSNECLIDFDVIILYLMAIMDISARAVHSFLSLSSNPRDAGWHKRKWVKRVHTMHPGLAKIAQKDSHVALLNVLTTLRNTIHAVPVSLNPTIPFVGEHALEVLTPLPIDLPDEFDGSVETLGGPGRCGIVHPFSYSKAHIRPGVFVERVLPRVLSFTEELMSAIVPENDRGGFIATRLDNQVQARRIIWALGIGHIPG